MKDIFASYTLAFDDPWALLAIIPAVICIAGFYAWRYWSLRTVLADSEYLRRLHGEELGPQAQRYVRGASRFSLITALLIIVYAGPHSKAVIKEPVYGGVRIAFLKDVSTSMKLAHDVDPYPDRLAAAKDILATFASMTEHDPELKGQYWMSVIPFAGSAMVYMPFSTSYKEFVSVIDSIDETTIGHPGTNLWEPVRRYEQMLADYPKEDADTVDIMILISDGGKGEGTHLDVPHIRAALARMNGVVPFAVGIGDPIRGTPLEYRDRYGKRVGYALEDPEDPRKVCRDNDPKCRPSVSILDERTLRAIAGASERYIHYKDKDAFLRSLKQAIIDNRKLVRIEQRSDPSPRSLGWWFLVPATILLLHMLGLFRVLWRSLTFVPSTL